MSNEDDLMLAGRTLPEWLAVAAELEMLRGALANIVELCTDERPYGYIIELAEAALEGTRSESA